MSEIQRNFRKENFSNGTGAIDTAGKENWAKLKTF